MRGWSFSLQLFSMKPTLNTKGIFKSNPSPLLSPKFEIYRLFIFRTTTHIIPIQTTSKTSEINSIAMSDIQLSSEQRIKRWSGEKDNEVWTRITNDVLFYFLSRQTAFKFHINLDCRLMSIYRSNVRFVS
jgi:hypothetical protein